MRFEVLHDYPEVVINIKTIPGLNYIKEEDGILKLGALTRLEDGVAKSARICLNAVYSNPYRATKAEEAIEGKSIDEANAESAGAAAVSDAAPLPYNKFKIQIAKTLVKRTILACNNIRVED